MLSSLPSLHEPNIFAIKITSLPSPCVWFNFNEERGGEKRGAKSLLNSLFASLQIGGIQRGGEGRNDVLLQI
jgi:hypothetical protein